MAKQLPIIINNFNRLTAVKNMVEKIDSLPGCYPIILDNASTYPPLLEWYKTNKCSIARLNENLGHLAPWKSGVVPTAEEDWYIVTDPDLDIANLPDDTISVLKGQLEGNTGYVKCGLSLRIDDLPNTELGNKAREFEKRYWRLKLGDNCYVARTDTTFAIYNKTRHPAEYGIKWWAVNKALRMAPPYTARHLPWYLTPENTTDEDIYYLEHSCSETASWNSAIAKDVKGKVGKGYIPFTPLVSL